VNVPLTPMLSVALKVTLVRLASRSASYTVAGEGDGTGDAGGQGAGGKHPPCMSITVGSSNQSPVRPIGARVSTRAPRASSVCLPDVSTRPPSPPCSPPRASTWPWKVVWSSAQATTVPPWPLSVAEASSTAPRATRVVCAFASRASLPCQPPPIRISPPPASPLASTRVVPPTATV
jgi:hypothetical protein